MKTKSIFALLGLFLVLPYLGHAQCDDPEIFISVGDADDNQEVCEGVPFTLRLTPASCTIGDDFYFIWNYGGTEEIIENNTPEIVIPGQENTSGSGIALVVSVIVKDQVGGTIDVDTDPTIGTSQDFTVTILPEMGVAISVTGGSQALCLGNDISLQAVVSGGGGAPFGSISWTGDVSGSTLTVTDQDVATNSPTYSVTVTDSDGCSASTTNNSISINNLPNPVISGDQIYCSGDPLSLNYTPAVGSDDCSWSVASGSINPSATDENCTLAIASLNADDTNDYRVEVTDQNGCVGTSADFSIEVFELDVSVEADLSSVCSNDDPVALTLSSTGDAPTSETLTANGASLDPNNPVFVPQVGNSGDFTIVYTASNQGCTDSDNTVISVLPIPEVVFTQPIPTVCQNNSSLDLASLVSPAGGTFSSTDVSLPPDGNLDPVTFNPNVIQFTYEFVAANTCRNTVTGNLEIDPELIATMGESFEICEGFQTNLDVNPSGGAGSGYTYSWSNAGSINNASIQSPELLSTVPAGEYEFILTLGDANGCSTVGSQNVGIEEQPEVLITHEPSSFCDTDILLMTAVVTGGTGEQQYFWENEPASDQNTFVTNPITGSTEISVQVAYPDFATTGCMTTFFDTLVVSSPSPSPSILSLPESNVVCSNSVSVFFASDTQEGTELDWQLGSINQFVDSTVVLDDLFYVYWSDNLSGGETIFLQEAYPGSCDTIVSIDVQFSNSESPEPSEVYLSELNNILYYNQSGLCYNWGTINPNPNLSIGEPYINFDIADNQFQSLVVGELDSTLTYFCQTWLPGDCNDPASSCSNTVLFRPKDNSIDTKPPDEEISFTVFPNPNNGEFSFRIGDLSSTKTYSWELRNLLGQIIKAESFIPSGSDHVSSITLDNRAQGIYLLSISDGDNTLQVSRVSIQY